MDRDADCSICLEKLVSNDNCCYVTNCNHIFHRKCLSTAITLTNKCPICRTDISLFQKLELLSKPTQKKDNVILLPYMRLSNGHFMSTRKFIQQLQQNEHFSFKSTKPRPTPTEFRCITCNKRYASNGSLRKHYTSQRHRKLMELIDTMRTEHPRLFSGIAPTRGTLPARAN